VVQERKTAMNRFGRTRTVVLGHFGRRLPDSLYEERISATLFDQTIEAIDPTGLNITVQTAGSRDKRSMPIVSSAVVKGIGRGDRVSLGLDQEGRILRIRKLFPIFIEAPEPRADQ
jgi:hypothetical protein